MSQLHARPGLIAVLVAIGLASGACSGTDRHLRQQRDNVDSLSASTAAIGEAWLAGSLSGTFTATALEQVFALLEQQRQALAAAPEALLDPRGIELSQTSETLARVLAAMIHDVRAADVRAVREHLSKLPMIKAESQ